MYMLFAEGHQVGFVLQKYFTQQCIGYSKGYGN